MFWIALGSFNVVGFTVCALSGDWYGGPLAIGFGLLLASHCRDIRS